jgi:hypothetical protein
MPLKDLVAEKGALDEAVIERIISPYVRYDIEGKEVHFTAAFSGLSNKAKIFIYLVALQGWQFVTDEPIPSDARPADIVTATGIPGGSVRPTLSALCERHHLFERDGRYSVRGTSLPVIESELRGGEDRVVPQPPRAGTRKAPRKGRVIAEARVEDVDNDEELAHNEKSVGAVKRPRKIAGKTGNLAATFDRWIDEGYFDEPRTLSEVQKRFRKQAIMVPRTSLPGYFLSAVRKGRLTRDEMQANGKTVWAYTTGANAKTRAT